MANLRSAYQRRDSQFKQSVLALSVMVTLSHIFFLGGAEGWVESDTTVFILV